MISIIIPVTEGRKYLEETIKSCLEQTYNDIEIVVIARDDAPYTVQLPQIKTVTYSKNESIIKGYNEAIKVVSGDYIAFLQAGDVAVPNRLQIQMEAIQKEATTVLVCSDMSGIDQTGVELYASYCSKYRIKVHEEEQTKQLVQTNFVSASTIMMKSIIKDSVFPIPEDLPYEDWWIGVIASLYGKIHFIHQPLVKHLEQPEESYPLGRRRDYVKERVAIAASNSLYYKAFADYFRKGKHHYLAVIQPMELRDTLMSTYALNKRLSYYYSERTYMCRRKIRRQEKLKIQAYLWLGPYLLLMK